MVVWLRTIGGEMGKVDLFGWMVRAAAFGRVLRAKVSNSSGAKSSFWGYKMKLPLLDCRASRFEREH